MTGVMQWNLDMTACLYSFPKTAILFFKKTSILDRLLLLNEAIHAEENTDETVIPTTGNGRRLYETGRRAQGHGLDNSKVSESINKARQKKDSHNKGTVRHTYIYYLPKIVN